MNSMNPNVTVPILIQSCCISLAALITVAAKHFFPRSFRKKGMEKAILLWMYLFFGLPSICFCAYAHYVRLRDFPTPPYNFSTVDLAKQAAVRKYPNLGKEGSSFNQAFVTRYKLYVLSNPKALMNPNWPLLLADETATATRGR